MTEVTSANTAARVGVIVIGRNEGQRLRLCLTSVQSQPEAGTIVYVDSGSTDGSVELAAALGVVVQSLDMRMPFTAARARNAGACRLRSEGGMPQFIQFVDGDCEVVAGWLDVATAFLVDHHDVAAVCGRRRERFPERSIYNLLCDVEWNTPVGEAKACGGDVLLRAEALRQVGGYRDDLVAGEEPELCVRLRGKGWRIWRLGAEMTLHDADITRFGQWWRRTMRTGFAYAEGTHLHGAPPERHWRRETRSALVWGLVLPAALVAGAVLAGPLVLFGFLLYPLQVMRLAWRASGSARLRWVHALFLVLGKFAEAVGEVKFLAHRLSGTRGRLIEYK